jgi:siroheme synthase-like protein
VHTHGVFLRLEGRRCVVVGDDDTAAAKAAACERAGAEVTVVSAAPGSALQAGLRTGRWRHVARAWQPGDLAGAALVYACLDDSSSIDALRQDATRERVLLNVVDVPEACDFFAGALVERGDLTVLVGTGGSSPAAAAAVRRRLEDVIGVEYGPFVDILGAVRRRLAAGERAGVLRALCESPLLELIRRGDAAGVDGLLTGVAGSGCTLARSANEPAKAS